MDANGFFQTLESSFIDKLSGNESNRITRQTAHFLFGPDHTARIYNTGLRKQGLIQIFYDYCMNRKPERLSELEGLLKSF